MKPNLQMEQTISWLLIAGTSIAMILVITGGTLLLWHDGHMLLSSALLHAAHYHFDVLEIISLSHTNPAIGYIELGLLCLVFTQILRIALLCYFYLIKKDMAFTLISLFILAVLIYSTVL